jgi:DNA helicase-2/ATP-dependent DNA helicase PcrA
MIPSVLRCGRTPLVVIEAPAGCGKTHQGADYARDVAGSTESRILILTHTHAACSVFADRTKAAGPRAEIRTIDSVIAHIAGAYHAGLGLPADVALWVREQDEGHAQLALKVSTLLKRYPMIAASLAQRYPTVVCDEHQDSSGDQHAIIMAMLARGSRVRIFADPMQRIFREKGFVGSTPACDWDELSGAAQAFEQLDKPHRWNSGCAQLGEWTLKARAALKAGSSIDLRSGLPPSVQIVFAENQAQKALDYQLFGNDRKPIDTFEKAQSSLLILTRQNQTARSLRSFFYRRIPLWEGHTRYGLERLVDAISAAQGDPAGLATATVTFMGQIGKGFSPSAFGDRFVREAKEGCTGNAKGKPAAIQNLARFTVAEPDHRGVAKMLSQLDNYRANDPAFKDIEIDHHREFQEAIRLGEFAAATDGLAEITHRRTYSRPKPPQRAISNIHKAKGLECESVIVMPCDGKTFPDKTDARCLLYVALSRAKRRLMLVVSRKDPSPLLLT